MLDAGANYNVLARFGEDGLDREDVVKHKRYDVPTFKSGKADFGKNWLVFYEVHEYRIRIRLEYDEMLHVKTRCDENNFGLNAFVASKHWCIGCRQSQACCETNRKANR